jgi:hypothetical protein
VLDGSDQVNQVRVGRLHGDEVLVVVDESARVAVFACARLHERPLLLSNVRTDCPDNGTWSVDLPTTLCAPRRWSLTDVLANPVLSPLDPVPSPWSTAPVGGVVQVERSERAVTPMALLAAGSNSHRVVRMFTCVPARRQENVTITTTTSQVHVQMTRVCVCVSVCAAVSVAHRQ